MKKINVNFVYVFCLGLVVAASGFGFSAEAKGYKAALPLWGDDFSPLCRDFIKKDGSIGEWGEEFIEAMYDVEDRYGYEIFFGSGSELVKLGSRCKTTDHFKSLTRNQQEHIWVWVWASIAQAESSCKPDETAQGIWNEKFKRYNLADGLMQLEYRTETRNANNRDKVFCPDKTDSQAIDFQARCSSSIMATQQSGKFIKDRKSYWQKLRPGGDAQIFARIKKHPLCG